MSLRVLSVSIIQKECNNFFSFFTKNFFSWTKKRRGSLNIKKKEITENNGKVEEILHDNLNLSRHTNTKLFNSSENLPINLSLLGHGDKSYSNEYHVKISNRTGRNSLFEEYLDDLRGRKHILDEDIDTCDSEKIINLSKDELYLTKKVFESVNVMQPMEPELERRHLYIDPYWDPFHKLKSVKGSIEYEFENFSKVATYAETRKKKILIKRALKQQSVLYNPYSKESEEFFHRHNQGTFTQQPPDSKERFWTPASSYAKMLKNNKNPICWRDIHILHNFVAHNGQILPRRMTYATKFQQNRIYKAITSARCLALFPYKNAGHEDIRMPIMDPLQYTLDELTYRYTVQGDIRAQAMIRVLLKRGIRLNYRRYLKHIHKIKTVEESCINDA